MSRRKIEDLITEAKSPETAQALVDWVRELHGRIGILSVEEVERAPEALRRAIDCGIGAACLDLAAWYTDPPFGDPDFARAEEVLRSAIAANVQGAKLQLVELWWFYRRDDASPDERREAHALATAMVAAQPGNADALYLLGLLTCGGFGTAADPTRAAQLQEQSAALGSARAMFEAYVYYESGLGGAKDSTKAFDYMRRAADQNHPRALYNMGACYATGRMVEKDLAKSIDWYTRASNVGHLGATATLAMMYARGEGVEKDLDHAKQLFDEAEYMGLDVSEMRRTVDL